MTPNIVCHFQSYRLLWYEYVPSTPGLKNKLFHHPCPLYQTQYRGLEISHKCRLRLKCDGKGAETRFRLSAKRTSPFKSAGASVQSTTGSRGVRISGSNAGYTMFRGSVKVLATHSILLFPLHFPSRASLCTITFQLDSTTNTTKNRRETGYHSFFIIRKKVLG